MIPLADLLAVAGRFQQFGALAPAEQLYRCLLREQPDNAEAWCRLGDVCHTQGQPGEALVNYRHALHLRPDQGRVHNNLGVVLMEQGQLDEAISSYQEALRLQPEFAEAHNNLGLALTQQGRMDRAAGHFREALRLKPAYPAALRNLGHALERQGYLSEAAACFGRAVQLQPDFVSAWVNLGNALRRLGRREEAGASYERAVRLRPNDPGPLGELAGLLMELRRPAEAVVCYEQALRLRPDSAGLCNNLGLALLDLGRYDEALLSFQQTLFLQPDLAEPHNNLGLALLNLGRAEEAILRFREALRLRPNLADAHNNLGLALAARGEPDESLTCYERAVQIDGNHVGALTNLGNAYKDQGYVAEALACYRKAMASRPGDAKIHSNLLLALQYQDGTNPRSILDEARRYAQQQGASLAGTIQLHTVRTLAGRRLRIGYVSADFREHPVAYFLEPILLQHDRRHFEIFCYADVPRPDAVTQRLQGYTDQWRSLVGLSDAAAAEVIGNDGIDILVDLAGHTGGNRLLVFARKPAPIQATYLGYLGTTGLPGMDYYLTDAHADPPEQAESYYQEQLIRLPVCGFCYGPGPAPEVHTELPAEQSGQMMFGCLNTLAKLSEEALLLWSRILAAVPRSRILLRGGAGQRAEKRVGDILARHGLSPERVLWKGRTASRFDYLKLYHAVDLCLDPFPYNGVTTTCDALWMGVPVLSLAGRTGPSRQGVRFLRNVGLEELIAETPEAYVRRAIELTGDLRRLAALRLELRERMSRSPLMDAPRFTRHLEAAYLAMRDRWFGDSATSSHRHSVI